MQLSFLLTILLIEVGRHNFLLKSFIFAIIYNVIAIFIFNYASLHTFIFNDYHLLQKLKIIFILFLGSYQALTLLDTILLGIVSLLFGVNLELVIRKIKFLKKRGGLHITFGAGLISLVAVGCATCGLSFGSLIGLSWVIGILPFHGLEFYIISIGILLFSLYLNLQTVAKVCKIEKS